MKKLLQLGAILCSFLITQSLYSQNNGDYNNDYAANGAPAAAVAGNQGGCPEDHPCGDQAVGDCWCLYVHYEPCYYQTKRCVEEQIPCKKRCCRMVERQCEVQRCRMVPEYYTETACYQEPEYYEVDDCKTCKKWVCDQHCEYVPKYYWKHVCGQPDCGTACPR
jgi:hypothetical protein